MKWAVSKKPDTKPENSTDKKPWNIFSVVRRRILSNWAAYCKIMRRRRRRSAACGIIFVHGAGLAILMSKTIPIGQIEILALLRTL
jgi:hypothetical protein